ncbi:Hypothetical predicted protein [Paramuricea clavata]|uniref:Uncharacterized protein n=1 Tax=Paramuricea clavata TaxID=317549 RepID=A0A6S7FN32_PARCT|nr:Hypothetical predicted protein [Paramuricea clavata]
MNRTVYDYQRGNFDALRSSLKSENLSNLRQRLKKSPSDYLRHKFKTLRATIKLMIKISRSSYISSLCTNIQTNSKCLWSLFKLKGATRSVPEKISIKTSVDNVREYAENLRDIATLFNRYFVSIFSTIFNDIILSEGTVHSVLRNLDNNKAHGPDAILVRLLTETAYEIAPSLCLLFNKSLKSGIVPSESKLVNVVPIHKKGIKIM